MAKRKKRDKRSIPVVKIPGTEYPEEDVLADLLKSSEKFRAFYQAERKKIKKTFRWKYEPNLPPGINFRHTVDQKGNEFIRLKQLPIPLADEGGIAEELMHAVYAAEGFPASGGIENQSENLSSALNGLAHDTLVYPKLQFTYGFDMCDIYKTNIQEVHRDLEKRPNPPSGLLNRTHWIFNVAGFLLEWDAVCKGTSKGNNEFQIWFNKRYPEIGKEAQDLVTLVKNIGYDTPEKMTLLFSTIIQKYKLEKHVFLPPRHFA